MAKLTKEQIEQIIEVVHQHQNPDHMVVFNGDKQKLFNAITRIETKVNSLSCKYHRQNMDRFSDELNKAKVEIEKSKYTNIMALFSIFASLSSVIGVIIVIMNNK